MSSNRMKHIIPELVWFLLKISRTQNAMIIHEADEVLAEQKMDAADGKSFYPAIKDTGKFSHPTPEIKAGPTEAASEEEDSGTVAGFFFGVILSVEKSLKNSKFEKMELRAFLDQKSLWVSFFLTLL
ncbi:hypothetical protein L3X38_004158 [Prunus dulcis]|uniref:Uncharacterized protein n=1 Tax=Prunus dulcis TaxID=3755 RepID=A0AAD4ZNG4_PRUDU|nr:hypothetical protein L3X38_004158 [Prunus dulcis]